MVFEGSTLLAKQMKDLAQEIRSCSGRDLEERKHWYSPAAADYNKARPLYPQALLQQVIEIAQLSAESTLLEVGCGPGTATVPFAQLDCSIIGLEPNSDFCAIALQNCSPYPKVDLQNTSFEEWQPEGKTFDAVVAASSFHWIPADVGYPKAASILKENGSLILLWNKELQPAYDVHQRLSDLYRAYAPSLERYEDQATQEQILHSLGSMMTNSGLFADVQSGQVKTEVIYTADEYLRLLNTYSPYLKLDPDCKKALFTGLKDRIEQNFGGSLALSYLSAFHIAQPIAQHY
jgi:SAM-dependent methyltransferase